MLYNILKLTIYAFCDILLGSNKVKNAKQIIINKDKVEEL